jgi:ParB family chromosome partitioning protein
VKAGISIEELAEDIARRTLLQSLSVRAVLDPEGQETGMFEVPAGGRRFRALELLVKQKRMTKTQPVPCVVREGGLGEEDSLAENVQRVALHPLDQFRAFQTLREKGLSEEEIAARFFVNPTVVKQRLRLAAVSEKLLDVYAADGMTLEQLMAFTVINDHARQEQVWGNRSLAPTTRSRITSVASLLRARSAPPTSARSSSASTPMKRPVASCCATCFSMMMAGGFRIRRCSTAW